MISGIPIDCKSERKRLDGLFHASVPFEPRAAVLGFTESMAVTRGCTLNGSRVFFHKSNPLVRPAD